MSFTTATLESATITGLEFVSAYVDDFEKAYEFYAGFLGLQKKYDMGEQACFFSLGTDHGLYLEGGNATARSEARTSHPSFTFSVPSASALFEKLKAAGVETVESAPMDMGGDMYWFRFYDPAGNLLEALGGA